MKAVSLFDMTMQAVREHRYSRDEALEIIDELRAIYPDVFEQSGIESESTATPRDFAERLPGRMAFGERMNDTEPLGQQRDIEGEDDI